jgi:hypothetical protein
LDEGYTYVSAGSLFGQPLRLRFDVNHRHRAAELHELEVATERVPATLHMRPLYDPAMTRIKA